MSGLIINGDDFGISSATNAAILRAHREGILTSASLMVNGAAFDEAVAFSRANPRLRVGIHLVLVQGRATLPVQDIPDLVDAHGCFKRDPVRAGLAYFFSSTLAAQIRKEMAAQLGKFNAAGLTLDHVNGHLNIHVHPTVLKIIMDLAPVYGIKTIRLPREELFRTLRLDARRWWWKVTQWTIFQLLSLHARRRLKGSGIAVPDRAYGLLQIGCINEHFLLGLLDSMDDGNYEVSFHLGAAPEWPAFYDGGAELGALLSSKVRERLSRSGRQLMSYQDLVAVARQE